MCVRVWLAHAYRYIWNVFMFCQRYFWCWKCASMYDRCVDRNQVGIFSVFYIFFFSFGLQHAFYYDDSIYTFISTILFSLCSISFTCICMILLLFLVIERTSLTVFITKKKFCLVQKCFFSNNMYIFFKIFLIYFFTFKYMFLYFIRKYISATLLF